MSSLLLIHLRLPMDCDKRHKTICASHTCVHPHKRQMALTLWVVINWIFVLHEKIRTQYGLRQQQTCTRCLTEARTIKALFCFQQDACALYIKHFFDKRSFMKSIALHRINSPIEGNEPVWSARVFLAPLEYKNVNAVDFWTNGSWLAC